MKKITALLLALCMVFALAACGTPAADPTDAPATDAADTDAPEATDAVEETPEATENPYADMTNEELLAQLETVVPGTLTVATSRTSRPMSSTLWTRTAAPIWPALTWLWPSIWRTTWASR